MKRYIRAADTWLDNLTSDDKERVEEGWDKALDKLDVDVSYNERTETWLISKDRKVVEEISDYDRMEHLLDLYRNTKSMSEYESEIVNWLKSVK